MMNPFRDTFDVEALRKELVRDEGLVLHVYKDPGSGRAIGVGRNLDTQGISPDELAHLGNMTLTDVLEHGLNETQALYLLDNDIHSRAHQLDVFWPQWRMLTPVRQRVLLNMAFEMGTHGMILNCHPVLELIQQALYEEAANWMEASPWGRRIPKRPRELAQMMRLDKPVDRLGNPT